MSLAVVFEMTSAPSVNIVIYSRGAAKQAAALTPIVLGNVQEQAFVLAMPCINAPKALCREKAVRITLNVPEEQFALQPTPMMSIALGP